MILILDEIKILWVYLFDVWLLMFWVDDGLVCLILVSVGVGVVLKVMRVVFVFFFNCWIKEIGFVVVVVILKVLVILIVECCYCCLNKILLILIFLGVFNMVLEVILGWGDFIFFVILIM